MSSEIDVAKLAGVQTIERGSVTLVDSTDALRIVDACNEERMLILGIDGFLLRGTSVVPVMDVIADFSGVAGAESIVLARQFIAATARPGLWYEFVVQSRSNRGDSVA